MKNIYVLFAGIMAVSSCFTSCQKEEVNEIKPGSISNLTATPKEGRVVLRWTVPSDSSLVYVQAEYQHPQTGETFKKNASVFVDSLVIDGLLAKDGEYLFKVAPVSATETRGDEQSVKCTALPVQPRVEKKTNLLSLAAENLYCNAPDQDEGKNIGFLVDSNYDNFFHTDWHGKVPGPHYLDITLPEPVAQFEMTTWYRGGGRGGTTPAEITFLGSNDGETWEEIKTVYDDGSQEQTDRFTTPVLGKEDKSYTHLRYRVDKSVDGNEPNFWALAEIQLSSVAYEIYDPEGIYKPE